MYWGFVAGWKYPLVEKSDANIGALAFGVPKVVDVALVAEVVVLLAGLWIGSTRAYLRTGSGSPYFFPSTYARQLDISRERDTFTATTATSNAIMLQSLIVLNAHDVCRSVCWGQLGIYRWTTNTCPLKNNFPSEGLQPSHIWKRSSNRISSTATPLSPLKRIPGIAH
jgi:hypothetical protein